MKISFDENGWEDYLYFENNDKKIRNKINSLIKDIVRNGANEGIGKPEKLTGNLTGYYSRRIDDKNRLIYTVKDDLLIIIQCRMHYNDY